LYASYTDFKAKLVPDNLVYGMIGLGILIRLVQAFLSGFESVYFTLTTFLIYSVIGFVFYRFRGWADGDFGMFVAISLFLPSNQTAPWPAYFSYISNLAFIGVAYAFIYTIYLGFQPKIFRYWSKGMTQPAWFISFVLGILLGFATNILGLTYVPGFVFGFITYPLIMVSTSLNKFMKRWVLPKELETGDWVLEDVRVGRKVVISKDNPGLSREQIIELEKLYDKGRVKKVLIKDGIPFIPVFFLSYLASVFYGDLIYSLVLFFV